MARSKLEFGYAANDGKGEYLRDGAIAIENALAELYMFISGGQSETTLPLVLPRIRGGTGAGGEQGSRKYVADQGVKTFNPVLRVNNPVAFCTVGLGTLPKTTLVTETTQPITFVRLGVGLYKCTVFDHIKIAGDYIYVQPDNFGNQEVCGVISHVGTEITITVYPVVFDSSTGKFKANTASPVDVPNSTFLSFVLVNPLGTLV